MNVLRAESANFVWAKADHSPVLMRLALDEPLTDLQLLHLLGPSATVRCAITVRDWSDDRGAFLAAIDHIEIPKRARRLAVAPRTRPWVTMKM